VLGTLLALALTRYDFFGKSVVNLLVILPIALPGIVTGVALQSALTTGRSTLAEKLHLPARMTIKFGLATIIIGHATFCIVVVFINAAARLRRLGTSLDVASADFGCRSLDDLSRVTFPLLCSAIIAGALLAFGLSFDEIVVTTFTAGPGTPTLPIWIYNNLFRPNQAPVVNVVAVVMVLLSIVPVWIAQRLGGRDALTHH
jgi:putative spermidine/putrescine transport system permease protein